MSKLDKGYELFSIETPDGFGLTPHGAMFEAYENGGRYYAQTPLCIARAC